MKTWVRRWRGLALLSVVAVVLGACAATTTATVRATPTVPPTATALPPTATLPPAAYAPVLVTRGFGCPDDLAQNAAGDIIFSDQGNGTVDRIAGGSVTTLVHGVNAPEGVIALADGTLIVGEQGDNGEHVDNIDVVPPGQTTATRMVTLHNATNTPGVDGLSRDPRTGDLLVADSPNGTVLRVSPDGRTITTLARGFVRPVAALADAAGDIFVADEYGNAVARIAPNGAVTRLAHLADPDDLAFDVDGSLLVTVLGDNTVVRLDPTTGHELGVLGRNLFEPQGMVVDAGGNIFVSEETANAIVELVRGRTAPGTNLPGLSGRDCH